MPPPLTEQPPPSPLEQRTAEPTALEQHPLEPVPVEQRPPEPAPVAQRPPKSAFVEQRPPEVPQSRPPPMEPSPTEPTSTEPPSRPEAEQVPEPPRRSEPPKPSEPPPPLAPQKLPEAAPHAVPEKRAEIPRPPQSHPKPVAKPLTARPEFVPRSGSVAPGPANQTSAAPQPAMPPTAASPVDGAWQNAVAGWLASHKNYPEDARRLGEQGRVVIRFTVERSGRVLDANIVDASGSARLDAASVALVRNASLPAFPASMTRPMITITTTIRYTLR